MLSCYLIGEDSLVIQCAQVLIAHGFNIHAIISACIPVQVWAQANRILYGSSLKDTQPISQPFAYLFSIINPHFIPQSVWSKAKQCAINYHDSPLPYYAGVNATSWALLERQKTHGVTWHRMNNTIDGGDILKQKIFCIAQNETALSLNMKCYQYALALFKELVHELTTHTEQHHAQDVIKRTYYGLNDKPIGNGWIAWSQSAKEIECLYRACALGHYPNRFSSLKFKLGQDAFIIHRLKQHPQKSDQPPGTLLTLSANQWLIATRTQNIVIESIFTPEGQSQSLADLEYRYHLQPGACLHSPTASQQTHLQQLSMHCATQEAFWVSYYTSFKAATLPFITVHSLEPHTPRIFVCVGTGSITSWQEIKQCLSVQLDSMVQPIDFIIALWIIYLSRLGNSENGGFILLDSSSPSLPSDLRCFIDDRILFDLSLDLHASVIQSLQAVADERQMLKTKPFPLRDLGYRYSRTLTALSTPIPIMVLLTPESDIHRLSAALLSTPFIFRLSPDGTQFSWWIHSLCLHNNPDLQVIAHHIKGHFQTLLNAAISNPKQSIHRLPLLTANEQQMILQEWNQTDAPYPKHKTIDELFTEQVKKSPYHPAIEYENTILTYALLEQKANQLAKYLIKQGIRSDPFVAIYMDRSALMVIAILGILKTGRAYIPISPHATLQYIATILQASHSPIRMIITNKTISQQWHPLQQTLQHPVQWIHLESILATEQQSSNIAPHLGSSNDLAYMIFTSGTTGQPKGIMIKQHSVVNLILEVIKRLNVNANSRILQFAALSFDASVWEIFSSLLSGAILCIPPAHTLLVGPALAKTIHQYQITTVTLPPSIAQTLVQTECPTLKILVTAGETCPQTLAEYWDDRVIFMNAYGPTEATVCATLGSIILKAKRDRPSIGKPIANVRVYILDTLLNPVPIGVIGELYIGGVGLSVGYFNQPDLNHKNFITHSFVSQPGQIHRLYRTGDLARWYPNGEIDYQGRIDYQVKIRGFRIELEAIEAKILKHPHVDQCVVTKQQNEQHGDHLVAYIVTDASDSLTLFNLQRFLQAELPGYMIPSFLMTINNLPYTPQGKIDRKKLPPFVYPQRTLQTQYIPPQTSDEKKIASIWSQIFAQPSIGINDNFFDLGGNSITLTTLSLTLEKTLKTPFPLSAFLRHPTITTLAKLITKKSAPPSPDHSNDLIKKNSLLPITIHSDALMAPVVPAQYILLTGSTGFLGRHLLYDLCRYTSATLYCLVSAPNIEAASQRIATLLIHSPLADLLQSKRILPLCGNLALPYLGLSSQSFAILAQQLDAIVHNGAWVNHLYDYHQLKATNVNSTIELLRLATTHKLKCLHFISTLGAVVTSHHPQPPLIKEEFARSTTAPLSHNGYLQSKWVSERLLASAYTQGVPVSIYRPSWISGEQHTGYCHANKNHLLHLLKACVQCGYAPERSISLDMLPVDFVSQAIIQLSTQQSTPEAPVFNLSHPNPITWNQLIQWMNQHGYAIKLIPYPKWEKRCLTHLNEDHPLYSFATLYLQGENKDWLSMQDHFPAILTRQTQSVLKKIGIPYPPLSQQYIAICLNYLKQIQFL